MGTDVQRCSLQFRQAKQEFASEKARWNTKVAEEDACHGRRDNRPHLVPGRTADISYITGKEGTLMKKGDDPFLFLQMIFLNNNRHPVKGELLQKKHRNNL